MKNTRSVLHPPHLPLLEVSSHTHARARMKASNTTTNLVDLSVGAIADHFHQLEDPRWILRDSVGGVGEKKKTEKTRVNI